MASKATLSIISNEKTKSKGGKQNQRGAGEQDVELGKRIRVRRVEIDISQPKLANKIGVTFQQVHTRKASTVSALLGCSRSPLRWMCP
jgi:hypothetical protein